MASAEIIIVGDEILLGEVKDENGPWLIEQCADRGIDVNRLTIVRDSSDAISREIRRSEEHDPDYIFITGGIGPTHDDCTRAGVARGLDRPLETNSKVLTWLHSHYGDQLNEDRRSMAELPEGSEPNILKEVPALSFRTESIYVFPGFPQLLRPLFVKWSDVFQTEEFVTETCRIDALEGEIAQSLKTLQNKYSSLRFGSYPRSDGTVTVRIRGRDEARLEVAYRETKEQFERLLVEE